MNKIQQLLTPPPQGIEYKKLGEVCKSLPKGTLKKDEVNQTSQYPVINAGRELYGFYDHFNNIANAFTFSARGEYAGFLNYFDIPFWAGGLCYPYTSKDENILITKFIYYYLKSQEQKIMDTLVAHGSIPALNKSDVDNLKIPLPPIPVQEEIVRILDAFTNLQTNLQTELELRKKQYKYYRDKLLCFEDIDGGGGLNVEYKTLGEICDKILAGGDVPKNYKKGQLHPTEEFPYPIYSNGTNENSLYGYTDGYKIDRDAVTISARGTIGWHITRKAKFTPIVRLITLIPNQKIITTKYLNYVLDVIEINSSGGSIPQLTIPMVNNLTIPIPPLEEQKRIVGILDKFDKLVNDISIGIPAEIEMRKKQYEYYRDSLLRFEGV